MDLSLGVKGWCLEQCSSMEEQLKLMNAGILRTHQRNENGLSEDTTEATIAEYRMRLSKLDEILERSVDDMT